MISARLIINPLLPAPPALVIARRASITEILIDCQAPEWFFHCGLVRLNGHVIERRYWRSVYVKPEAQGVLELIAVPQQRNVALILGAVAATVLTAGIAAGGIATLFGLGAASSFAAGGLGASLAAAGVGIASQLALTALAKPPGQGTRDQAGDLAEAGIAGNQVTLLEPLPVIFGTVLYAPPLIAPAYTYIDGKDMHAVALFGVEGRCRIGEVKLNGTAIAALEGVACETGEGEAGGPPPSLMTRTVIEQGGVALSAIKTRIETGYGDQLDDQAAPDSSLASWHVFTTDGAADKVWVRLLFPAGILTTAAALAMVPLRIEIRRKGTSTWLKLPVFHVQSVKEQGAVRAEIKLKWVAKDPGGRRLNWMADYPVWLAPWKTGAGQSFEYAAESYFDGAVAASLLPVMTAATTAGVALSASSEQGANAAWKAADADNDGTYWRPLDNSLPAWLKIDLGAAQWVKSYMVRFNYTGTTSLVPAATAATAWVIEGSADNLTWTVIDTKVDDGLLSFVYLAQIANPGAYRYYRFTFTANNGANNQELHVPHVELYTGDVPPTAFDSASGGAYPNSLYRLARHVTLTPGGAEVYLQTATFPRGAYEIRVKRGLAARLADFAVSGYTWNGNPANADFFGYYLGGGKYKVRVDQAKYSSDGQVERFSTVDNSAPVKTDGIAWIAIDAANMAIESLAALFTSYAPTWDGTVWSEAESLTANPAALYRATLLGRANADPLPGEIVDEEGLAAWFSRCAAAGHQCNAVMRGGTVEEALGLLASCGYASPRLTSAWGVVEDYDTSSEPIAMMISPLNSRDLRTEVPMPRVPHAIRAEYSDAADDYAVAHVIVYREGFDAGSATLIETVNYQGFTTTATAAARARFDLKVAELRNRRYLRELGHDYHLLARGSLVGLTDDTLDLAQAYGIIRQMTSSAGNYVAITLDTIIPFEAGQDDLRTVGDAAALTDILNLAQPMGVAIRLDSGAALVKPVVEVTASNTVTFAVPFADDGSLHPGQIVACGVAGREFRRCRVIAIAPEGIDSATVTLIDECPEIFA